jgi:hypothetical protein
MKKKLILIMLLFIPFIVKAENIEKNYELCKSGCEYSDINTILQEVRSVDRTKSYDFYIEVKDGEEYEIERNLAELWYPEGSESNKSSFTLKGVGSERPTFSVVEDSYSIRFLSANRLILENIIIDTRSIDFHNNSFEFEGLEKALIVKNVEMHADNMWIRGKNLHYENVKIDTGSILSDGIDNALYKNVEITINDRGTQPFGLNFRNANDVFENCTITTNGKEFEVWKLTLNDSTVNGSIKANDNQKYTNTKIDGSVTLTDGYLNFDAVEVTKGITIRRTYCNNFDNVFAENSKSVIKNSKISNPDGNAVTLNVRDKNVTIDIDNTDLDNASCSVVSASPEPEVCGGANYTQNIRPTFLADTNTSSLDIQVNVKNSKVNCAMTSSEDTTLTAVNMYFSDDNNWTKKVSRGTDPTTFNIVELQNGHIYIDHKKEDVLRLNIDKDKPISSYFEDVIGDAEVLGEWLIGDPSILKIENGKIIPLKVGVTTISGVVNSEIYTIEITVKAEDLNPNTKDIVIAIIACTITAGLVLIIVFDKYKQSKVI